jgi:hypothetical protein
VRTQLLNKQKRKKKEKKKKEKSQAHHCKWMTGDRKNKQL